MDCRLVQVTSGSSVQQMFTLREGVTTIGRDSDNDIQILSEAVSRHHARIHNLPSVCEVEDARSSNGTQVSGKRIVSMRLGNGDEVKIGDCLFRFEECGFDGMGDSLSATREYGERSLHATVRIRAETGTRMTATGQPAAKPVPRPLQPLRPMQPLRPLQPKPPTPGQ